MASPVVKGKEILLLAVESYDPQDSDDLGILEAAGMAPELEAQLAVEKGCKFVLIGEVCWWLHVKCLKTDEQGYIPSIHVVPLKDHLLPADEIDLACGGKVSYGMLNLDVNLKFFPSVPTDYGGIKREPCPENSANILSKATFWWLNSLIFTGFKRPLVDKDMWSLAKKNRSDYIIPRVEAKWNKEEERLRRKYPPTSGSGVHMHESAKTRNGKHVEADKLPNGDVEEETVEFVPKKDGKMEKKKTPSLTKVIGLMFWRSFLLAAFLKLTHDCLLFVEPYLLNLLIQYTEEEDSPDNRWTGYMYALVLFLSGITRTLVLQQYFHIMFRLGMNIRTCVVGMVYPKALRLSNKSRKQSTAGEMVNLLSVDAQRLMDLMSYFNTVWSSPLQIAIALYFLYNTMGVSILAGIGVMLLLIPLNMFVTKLSRKLQVKTMEEKDKRMKIIGEVLNGIKVLKLYAWEYSFMKKLAGIRRDELQYHKSSMYLAAGFSFTYTCAPFLVSLSTFAVYVLSGNELTAQKAFVAISLFNILRFPLIMFPNIIIQFIQARVSIKRVQQFLHLEELNPEFVQRTMPSQYNAQAIHVEDCSVTWDSGDPDILSDINLNIPEGSLVAVVGQVGCGKSTLLSALLGETEKTKGQVYVKGSVAYVPQQAWIQNATLRDNILFGREYDPVRYGKTVRACALQTDFDILPSGDSTEIGEKGINLSGGQKQRVNLARAVYFNADVYLLDDPLSAVDSHVGKHIFDKVIGPRGKLRNKTRVLVTHGISFLPQVDQIVVLQNGRISEIGTYAELQANQGAFAEFLKMYAAEHKDKEEEPIMIDSAIPTHIEQDDPLALDRTISIEEMGGSCEQLNLVLPARRRVESEMSHDSVHVEDTRAGEAKEADRMISEETSEIGSVKFKVFLTYFRYIGVFIVIFVMLLFILSESSLILSRFWLADWSVTNVTQSSQRDRYLGVYGAFGFAQAFFTLLSSFLLAYGSIKVSTSLHERLLFNILRSPMSFFESTPVGRIVNRFSKDIFVIDDTLPRSYRTLMTCIVSVLGSMIAISFATPLFLTVVFPLAIVYVAIQRVYVASSRQLRRIESVSRSPIYNNFLETINGTSTIRGYSQQMRFNRTNYCKVDDSQVAYYPWAISNRWLAVRLEFIGNLVILAAALFAVIARGRIDSGMVGLSITYAFQITQTLNWLVRMSGELETNIVAVERVKEYTEAPTEPDWEIEDHRPPDGWPNTGNIKIDSLDLRYRESLPLALKDISCDIQPGEKIGIVGRTGAGKSSLSLALFRMLEAAGGKIVIDGVDIAKIGLHDLRSRLTIIPQDPVLFSGTLRFNLDPFDAYSDEDLWEVLEVSHLKAFASGLPEGLLHPIAEGGENLSVGQRQLVCLARALLRKSKVLVLDEATAAVDLETDELIQNTIRTEFAERTVLTIAHRLNTIMDYTRVLVMDRGCTREFDSPQNLLAAKGIFYGMAKDAGLAP
ncbi:multidrug resistance-associated protein 1 [Nematostella vectensis]|uniref:multidrug resistance-associated protein 1 n=1 Tax=Nematostella vectensis TaxID=45351 RepID=UPI002076DAAF|nr:multidrug resistance-associated protein 1 [Nematostella vectensis]